MGATRREFLQWSAVGLAGLALVPGERAVAEVVSEAGAARASSGNPARVIVLISDGMSQGVPSLAENFSKLMRGKGTYFAEMLRREDVARGLFETYSLNSLVTDSAAAATALGSGTRVRNGAINMLPDGTTLRPILPLLKERGIGTGLVTTATVTHATPAGFAAQVERRGDEHLIAPQYLDVVDVVLGGGSRFFDSKDRRDGRDVPAEYAATGYRVARTTAELNKSTDSAKVLGLFSEGHMPYTIDHLADEQMRRDVPTLAEMTRASLEVLDRNPDGFLLQVEGARVDHAAHANDAAGILWDQLAFDDAVGVALEYAAKRPGTLIVVTSDHGNSNPGLNGMTTEDSGFYGASPAHFERLAASKCSVEHLERVLRGKEGFSAEDLREVLRESFGVEIGGAEAEVARAAWRREPTPILATQHQSFVGALGQILGNHTGIGWCGTTHTEDLVLIAALGPGQETFGRLLRNTDFFRFCTKKFECPFENPSMTLEQMARYASRRVEPAEMVPHWT